MAIRINLLAEAIQAEEDRRKDPVKRGTYAAAFVVFCVVLWAVTLQLKIMGAKSELGGVESKWKSIEKDYKSVVDAQKTSMDVEHRLSALHEVSTNRVLWGTVLNAFQQTLNNLDGVQVVKFKSEQTYVIGEGTPARTNGMTVIPGKPPTSTERVSLTIDAMDVSTQPGRRVNQFRESFASVPYFKENLNPTNGVLLISRSAPQSSPNGNQTFVMFSLKATFPEKTR